MVFYRRKKKTKINKRKTRTRKRRSRIPRSVGFPLKMSAKLNYNEIFYPTVSASSTDYYYFHSSLFDPKATVGGHQPLWRDTYASIYNQYRVISMSYHITAFLRDSVSTTTTTVTPLLLNVQWRTSQTMDIDPQTAAERRFDKTRWLQVGAGRPVVIKDSQPLYKIWGVNPTRVRNDDEFASLMTGDPGRRVYCNFMVQNPYSVAVPYIIDIKLQFNVVFFDRVDIGGS